MEATEPPAAVAAKPAPPMGSHPGREPKRWGPSLFPEVLCVFPHRLGLRLGFDGPWA